jgi:AraC-like DNA-binding protein
LPLLKNVVRAFETQNYIRPDLREGYELLIDYYANQDDKKSQLHYIDILLRADHVLEQNFKYLSGKIHKEYDTKKLLRAKETIENTMVYRTTFGFMIIFILAITIAFLIRRHFEHKRRFRELMDRKPGISKPIIAGLKENDPDISPEVVNAILKNLDRFEQKKRYLEKDMNLVKIASILNTNTKYVTKIIARFRGKRTIEYITELKIDHIVELLKNENKYRNYTNKALGEEAGFGSTQNFTRSFNARTGISPTYFIEQLKTQPPPIATNDPH